MIVINGENLIVGRVATFVAKKALLGEDVRIINCEKMYITGSKEYLVRDTHRRRVQGTWSKGPFYFRMPDRMVRRVVRGMLPHKTYRGKTAYSKVLCYIGCPEEFKNAPIVNISNASISSVPNLRYVSVGELSKLMGAKF